MTTPREVLSHSVRGGDAGTLCAVDFNKQRKIISFTLVKISVALCFFFFFLKVDWYFVFLTSSLIPRF